MKRLRLSLSNFCAAALLVLVLSGGSPRPEPENAPRPMPQILEGDLVFRRASGVGSEFVDALDSNDLIKEHGDWKIRLDPWSK